MPMEHRCCENHGKAPSTPVRRSPGPATVSDSWGAGGIWDRDTRAPSLTPEKPYPCDVEPVDPASQDFALRDISVSCGYRCTKVPRDAAGSRCRGTECQWPPLASRHECGTGRPGSRLSRKDD